MPNTTKPKRSRQSEPVHAPKKRRRRGPLIRFRFGAILMIWILCVVFGFGAYMIRRNVNPEIAAAELAEKLEKEKGTEHEDGYDEEPYYPEEELTPDEDASATAPSEPTQSDADSTSTSASSQAVIQTKINPVPEGAPQPNDYLNRCAFLGDSNVYYFGKHGLLQTMSVYSDEVLNLENYETHYFDLDGTQIKMLSAIRAASCPIYLMFGVKSLIQMTPEKAADLYLEMLNKVQAAAPESTIYVLSIPPVTSAAEKSDLKLLNSKIDQYNSLLLEIANNADVYYVDTNTALKNNQGRLDADKAMEDGVHLTADGGRMLLDYVLCHVPVT